MSYASRGPDTAIVSFPAFATLALPLTGAASSALPRLSACARISLETSIDTVEVSTTTRGTRPPFESRPLGPVMTAAKSGESATETTRMWRSGSDDELWRIDHALGNDLPGPDLLEQKAGRGAAELVDRHVHRGEARDEAAGQRDVVVTDDCHVLRDSQTSASRHSISANGDSVGDR